MATLTEVRRRTPFLQQGSACVSELLNRMECDDWPLRLDAPYQRGHVWTERQRRQFLGHFIEGGDVPKIVIRERLYDSVVEVPGDEVVDGKQRLETLRMFVAGSVPAELHDGSLLWFADFTEAESRIFRMSYIVPTGSSRNLSDADVLRLYLRLNTGGTVHTDDELDRVREMLVSAELEPATVNGE